MWSALGLENLNRQATVPNSAPGTSNATQTIGQTHRAPSLNDDETINNRPRNRQRTQTVETSRCCDCSRFAKCSDAPQTKCSCRQAGRECTDCSPNRNCCNRPSVAVVNGTIGGDFIPPPAPTNAAPRRNPRRSTAPTTPEESAAPPAEDEGQTDPTDDAPSDGDGNNSEYNPNDDPPSDDEEESGSPVETGATPNVNNPQQAG